MQNRPLSTNVNKIKEYIILLASSYNSIIKYTGFHKTDLPVDDGNTYIGKVEKCRNNLIKSFERLNCGTKVIEGVGLFDLIDVSDVIEGEDWRKTDEREDRLVYLAESELLELTMATTEQKRNYITMCSNIIRENFDGNTLALESFIDKIGLIEDFTEQDLRPTLITFLKSKLEGKAREALPETVSSEVDIKTALRNKIKPDSSKVVAGQIAALSVRNNNYADFAKQVGELSDALTRSLVVEGITKVKAREMAVEQTMAVYRRCIKPR